MLSRSILCLVLASGLIGASETGTLAHQINSELAQPDKKNTPQNEIPRAENRRPASKNFGQKRVTNRSADCAIPLAEAKLPAGARRGVGDRFMERMVVPSENIRMPKVHHLPVCGR